MNAATNSKLNDLYRAYVGCIDTSLKGFLSGSAKDNVDANGHAKEWCTTEKSAYFEYLRVNFRTEYENIIRLESQNY